MKILDLKLIDNPTHLEIISKRINNRKLQNEKAKTNI